MDPLREMRAAYPDLKIHKNEEYSTYVVLDMRNTPFWTSFFESELDAYIAFDYYIRVINRLTAEKEDMKARNRALRMDRIELIRRYCPGLVHLTEPSKTAVEGQHDHSL